LGEQAAGAVAAVRQERIVSRIRVRPAANKDIDREAINLASYAGVDAGLRFYDACEQSFSLLASYPELGVKRDFGFSILADLRLWRPKGFDDYLIFYRPMQGGVEILKVINGAQDLPVIMDELAQALQDTTNQK
jgi:toxin ParE1/3/4